MRCGSPTNRPGCVRQKHEKNSHASKTQGEGGIEESGGMKKTGLQTLSETHEVGRERGQMYPNG